jgi:membrane protein implicated in regulation of membrane protease activity
MTWGDFYLICFVLGVGISFLSWLTGSVHFHLPHIHIHFGGSHGHGPSGGGGRYGPGFINIGTIAAFLAWFGGAGYLLWQYHVLGFLVAFGAALLSGFAGAAILFWFLAKFLVREDEVLDPADYDMIGVFGKVISTIRSSGTGEMMFSQMGTRRSAPARSEGGVEISKGTEVVVTRYERGIAYVRPWEELSGSISYDKEST